jgi:SpoVK/Ycf46/Vps4 family AAA+-type ATPase
LDSAAKDLGLLFRSKHPLVVCETVEERRFEKLVRHVCAALKFPLSTWSSASGLSPSHPTDAPKTVDLAIALQHVRAARGEGVFLLKDPQSHLESAPALRALRETAQEFAGSPRTIVLVGPELPRKAELGEIGVRFEFLLPDVEDFRRLLRETITRLSRDHPSATVQLTRAEAEGIASDLQGLTMYEAERALSRAIVEDNMLSAADRPRIRQTKKSLVEGGGLLEFVAAPESLAQVGGLARLKKWVATRRVGFLPDGSGPPLDPPRGLLLLGVQGCGKSLAAKAIAATWEVPLLSLDAGRLLGPYVGESERNLREALQRVDRMAPCVLWIDEIEKAFHAGRSVESDGGISKRLLATLLTWMQERESRVFLVATANDVHDLPPELMRKGRIDEIFFVDLPEEPIRGEIFRLHLAKRGEDPARFDLKSLARDTKGFSGAEIEQAVVAALYEARAGGFPLDSATLLVSVRTTRPLSVIRAEKIAALREWARERCVPAD